MTDHESGFLRCTTHILVDRDSKLLPFCTYIEHMTETNIVLLPPRSPNLNAHLERFMRSLKSECLDRIIFFGENSLRKTATEFTEHYHHERNHQGLENQIPFPGRDVGGEVGEIHTTERLGGLLRYYYRRPSHADGMAA